jgi:hypothetical protein
VVFVLAKWFFGGLGYQGQQPQVSKNILVLAAFGGKAFSKNNTFILLLVRAPYF